MLSADKKWARQTVRSAMQVPISQNKAVLHALVYEGETRYPNSKEIRSKEDRWVCTEQCYHAVVLLQVSVPHRAATEPQKLPISLLFQNIDLSRYNTEAKCSDCFEGQELCYDVSAEL